MCLMRTQSRIRVVIIHPKRRITHRISDRINKTIQEAVVIRRESAVASDLVDELEC